MEIERQEVLEKYMQVRKLLDEIYLLKKQKNTLTNLFDIMGYLEKLKKEHNNGKYNK